LSGGRKTQLEQWFHERQNNHAAEAEKFSAEEEEKIHSKIRAESKKQHEGKAR